MATSTLTMDNFESTVKGDGITLVDFWATWCGPCRQFGPIFEATAEENPDVVFGKVDTEAEQQLAGALGIMSIPTLMIFRDGIQLFSQPGVLPSRPSTTCSAKSANSTWTRFANRSRHSTRGTRAPRGTQHSPDCDHARHWSRDHRPLSRTTEPDQLITGPPGPHAVYLTDPPHTGSTRCGRR